MARFIHLNGLPGIGKSTVASAFADQHPGVLNLDIDQIVSLIGGWRDNFSDAFEAGRPLGAAMARVHLASGSDVIMPQLITNARELADFESAAAEAEAEYCHILLIADVESSVDRFMKRPTTSNLRHETISKIVNENGGPDFLRKIHSQLTEFTADRQLHSIINCEQQTAEQTYRAVEAALRPA